jgi:hypothetical protein
MSHRLRITAPIDANAVSPDSIEAAATFCTRALFEQANFLGLALDWNTWRTYTRRKRNGDLILIQWVKAAKA